MQGGVAGPVVADQAVSVGVVVETCGDERRVALVPNALPALRKLGTRVVVSPGAGDGALLPDHLYVDAGATLGDGWAVPGGRHGFDFPTGQPADVPFRAVAQFLRDIRQYNGGRRHE